MALLIFKMTLCKRLCTFKQIVLLFNYHKITHAVNLGEKNPAKAKFFNLFKRFVILICDKISNSLIKGLKLLSGVAIKVGELWFKWALVRLYADSN